MSPFPNTRRHSAIWMAVVLLIPVAPLAEAAQITFGSASIVEFEWSPNGNTFAFTEIVGSSTMRISKVPSAGGAPVALTGTSSVYTAPQWTADGVHLLTSYVDGSLVHRVAAINATSGTFAFQSQAHRYVPAFGPARSLTAVVASAVSGPGDTARALVTMNLVAGTESPLAAAQAGNVRPIWTSSARGIVAEAPGSNGFLQLFERPAGGGSPTQLTSCNCDVCCASEASDGTIAYAGGASEGATQNLFVVAPGGSPTQITNDGVSRWYPLWAPDGNHLVFNRNDALSQMNIFRILKNGNAEMQMTTGPSPKRSGKISPNGLVLAYLQLDQEGSSKVWHLYTTPVPSPPIGMPAMSSWALIALTLMLAVSGAVMSVRGAVNRRVS